MNKEQEHLVKVLVNMARMTHTWVDDDDWYSCPKAPNGCLNEAMGTECNCGADEFNAKLDKLVESIWEAE